jgi:hypothetical protein
MEASVEQARNILKRDLDPDFVETFAIELGWEYSSLFEAVSADDAIDPAYKDEEFNRRRGDCAVRALVRAAKQHGVPFEFRRLGCNGQRKLLLKAGRVILIQEPTLSLSAHPSAADYKVELADMHGFVRQLELDLGDQPNRIRDWSGCVLGVVLHGPVGRKFDEEHKILGAVMLAVPDAAYRQWVLRLDLETLAMFGRDGAMNEDLESDALIQDDNVVVTPKRRNTQEDIA